MTFERTDMDLIHCTGGDTRAITALSDEYFQDYGTRLLAYGSLDAPYCIAAGSVRRHFSTFEKRYVTVPTAQFRF